MSISWVELAVPFVAAASAILFKRRERIAQERLPERTVQGTARVGRIHDWIYPAATSQTLARLAIEVRPPPGIPYRVWSLAQHIFPTATAAVSEGLVLDVRIDRQDPNIVYPAVDWARRR